MGAAGHAGGTEDQVERYERLRVGAEALRRLKPQEIRCLLLRAEGYSYRQICEATGFSYTKVNRCLTEGRQSFLARIEGIESGVECERLAPILSALADGEAGAADMAALRPHLRGCLACRATLKRYRATPVRVAALLPVGALAGEPDAWSPAGEAPGLVSRALEATGSWLQERAGAMSLKVQSAADRVQQVAEAGSAQKAAAVAASTAALAGGGVASVRTLDPGVGRDRADTRERSDEGRERVAETPLAGAPAPPPVPAAPTPEQSEAEVTAREPPSAPDPEPAAEFAPGPAATVSATAAAPRGTSSAPAPPHRGHESSGGGSAGGAGEFGP